MRLIKYYGEKCAYCQKVGPVDIAHIIPLEIGGTTVEENLVLLCKKCHRLYDSGFLSIHTMQELVKEWRAGTCSKTPRPPLGSISPPPPAMTPPPESVNKLLKTVLNFQNKGWYNKAIKTIDDKFLDSNLDEIARSYLLRKKAELTRRRSARGVIAEALNILQNVDQKKIPPEQRPIFFYELGYVYRLRGNHSEAAQIYRKSAEASKEIDSNLEYIAASVNEILCLLATKDSLNRKEAIEIIDRLNNFKKKAEEYGEYWGGRWALNCAGHKLQVCLKWGDKEQSWKALTELKNQYFNSDLRNGWDAASKQSISLLEGLVRTMFPRNDADLDIGIGLLARAFVTRLGPRQRPEGIRDVGFALVKAIRKTDKKLPKDTIDLIEKLMNQTMDGTSYLWPWRADN
jgi:tetratricopeptide (TPR) repeat protein